MWAYFEPGHLKLISSQRKQPGRSMDAVSPRKYVRPLNWHYQTNARVSNPDVDGNVLFVS